MASVLPVSPALAALAVAVAVLVLPRAGWLAAMAGLVAALIAVDASGLAVVVGAGLVTCAATMPRGGRAWSVPALAPLLGAASVASGYCALAGQARGAVRRAALGAVGFWWLALAEPVAGSRLLFGAPERVPPTSGWAGSARDAASEVLWPLLSGGALLGAVAWAVAALVLPWMVRGRRALADVVAAGAWAAGLAAAVGAVGAPSGGLAGPALAAALAVGMRWARGPQPDL